MGVSLGPICWFNLAERSTELRSLEEMESAFVKTFKEVHPRKIIVISEVNLRTQDFATRCAPKGEHSPWS